MIKSVLVVFVSLFSQFSFSQTFTEEELIGFKKQEELLKKIGLVLIHSENFKERRDANYTFIQQLTKVLKSPNSFHYDFSELQFMKIVEPKDQSFRILLWQVQMPGKLIRHYGAIQLNSKELKLFPLVDRSDDMKNPENFVGDNTKWFGALYYQVKEVEILGHKKYLLFGYDMNNPLSSKKVIEVLQFNRDRKPIFGAPIFPNWKVEGKTATRFLLEYAAEAKVSIKYQPIEKQIIFDNLVPKTPNDEGIFMNYVPDGTFNALNLENNRFVINKNIIRTNFGDENQSNQTSPKPRMSDVFYKTN